VSRRHPVWQVYDLFRTVRLNTEYYRCQLARATRRNFWIEIVLAVSASSAVGGLWVFTDLLDGALWKGLGAVAALLAIYQPVAKPAERIRSLEERVTRYKALAFDLRELIDEIEDRQRYGDPEREQFRRLLRKRNEVATGYVDTLIDTPLRDRCEAAIRDELPDDRFFIPGEDRGS
jgi:hypothetical protein